MCIILAILMTDLDKIQNTRLANAETLLWEEGLLNCPSDSNLPEMAAECVCIYVKSCRGKAECTLRERKQKQQHQNSRKSLRDGNRYALESPEIQLILHGWQFCIWQWDAVLKSVAHEEFKITIFACYCWKYSVRKKVVGKSKLYLKIMDTWIGLFYSSA